MLFHPMAQEKKSFFSSKSTDWRIVNQKLRVSNLIIISQECDENVSLRIVEDTC